LVRGGKRPPGQPLGSHIFDLGGRSKGKYVAAK
jgi:hypothetical protein